MRRLLFACLALAILPASAQVGPGGTFHLEDAKAEPQGGAVQVIVGWRYDLTNPAFAPLFAASGGTQILWDEPSCDDANVATSGALVTRIEGQPMTPNYRGAETFSLQLKEAAPPHVVACSFVARAQGFGPFPQTAPSKATVTMTVGDPAAASANETLELGPKAQPSRAVPGLLAIPLLAVFAGAALLRRKD